MKRRAASKQFTGPDDAFKIAGVLFALRGGPNPSRETLAQLEPRDPFAREIVNALVHHGKPRKARVSEKARAVARSLKPLAAARR